MIQGAGAGTDYVDTPITTVQKCREDSNSPGRALGKIPLGSSNRLDAIVANVPVHTP